MSTDLATAVKESKGDKAFTVVNYVVLAILLFVVLYPLIFIVSASLSAPLAVSSGEVWLWPVDLNLDGYKTILEYRTIVTGFLNSLFYATAGTLINVALTLLAAYPLSRRDLYGRNGLMFFFAFTMLFGGGLIPTYLVVKNLGLMDTRWALILPTAMGVWNMIVTRTFYQVTIPNELLESARMDGCNDFNFFWRIVLPLSKPIIAVNALLYAVFHWNEYFNALMYLTDPSLNPLQIVLREIVIRNRIDPAAMVDAGEIVRRQELRDLLKYALIVIALIPPLIAYPFVQKHFVKGIMIGSLKG